MEKKISVIIPVYNVEKYIRECLDSVLEQSLKDIEVICVNDGSTDESHAVFFRNMRREIKGLLSSIKKTAVCLPREMAALISRRENMFFFLDSDDVA